MRRSYSCPVDYSLSRHLDEMDQDLEAQDVELDPHVVSLAGTPEGLGMEPMDRLESILDDVLTWRTAA